MNYLIFLYILSLSQEFISVHFNYPFFGIRNKNPTKHYAFAFISTISLYCLHKLLAYVLPGSWCFCAIFNTFSKLLNIHAACEDSCCLILQIHGYSHSCILNCITILCSFILPYPGELLPDVTYTFPNDQPLPLNVSYSYQCQQLHPHLQKQSNLCDISDNALLNR